MTSINLDKKWSAVESAVNVFNTRRNEARQRKVTLLSREEYSPALLRQLLESMIALYIRDAMASEANPAENRFKDRDNDDVRAALANYLLALDNYDFDAPKKILESEDDEEKGIQATG